MTSKQPQSSRSSGEQKRTVHQHQRSGSRTINRRSNNGNGNGNSNGNNNSFSFDIFNNEEYQKNSDDRLLFLFVHSIGCEAEFQVNSGDKINGIIESIDPKSYQIFLKNPNDSIISSINFSDLIDFEIGNVDLFNNNYSSGANTSGSFKTDVETSRTTGNQRRSEMEKWVPEDNGVSLNSLSLNDGGNTNWDQFQTNEEKFGIVSEFDENLYTTRINKDDPKYSKYLEKATKLAKSIEGQSYNGNYHLAEERGLKFDDSGIDEEDKYSGVDRTQANTTTQSKGDALFESLINKKNNTINKPKEEVKSKYVPPSQRSTIQHMDPAIVSASKANSPTNADSTSTISAPVISSTTTAATNVESGKHASSVPAQTPSTIPAKPSIPSKPIVNKEPIVTSNSKKIRQKNELESLKEFSQNFKIPSKFPSDLLPIVSKDKTKQEEIVKKNDNEIKSPALSSTITDNSAPVNSSSTSISQSSSKPKTETPSAMAKKFNPKATSFTPSTGSVGSPTISHISSPNFSKNSPRLPHATYKQKRSNYTVSPASFFSPNKLPNSNKPRGFKNGEFNFFKGCLKQYKEREIKEKFVLEKPFTTSPIWSFNPNDPTFEKPYSSVFADLEELRLRQQQSYPYQQYPPQFPGFPQQAAVGFLPPQQIAYQQYPTIQQRFVAPIPANAGMPSGYQQQFQPMPFIQPGSMSPNQQPYYYQQTNPMPIGSPPLQQQQPLSNGGTPQQPIAGQLSPRLPQQQLPQQSPQFYQQRLPNGNFPPPGAQVVGGVSPPGSIPAHPGSHNGGGYNTGYNGGAGSNKGRKNNR